MEYEALLEGLTWATRLDLGFLEVCGDSTLVLKQISGEYAVKNSRLKSLRAEVFGLLMLDLPRTQCSFGYIPRERNATADGLASKAVGERASAVRCNWKNVNVFIAGTG